MKQTGMILGFLSLGAWSIWACGEAEPSGKAEATLRAEMLEKGSALIDQSIQTLTGELQAALQAGGPALALKHCQTRAVPLTDSLGQTGQIQLKRSSLQVRNPANAPDADEKTRLETYAEQLAKGEKLKPILEKDAQGRWLLTKPILMAEPCLKCHGQVGKSLSEAQQALILQHYPQDKATGYEAGQLRGIWALRF